MSTRVVRKASSGGAGATTTQVPFSAVGLANSPNVVTAAGPWVYGAWVQLSANVGANANGYGLLFVITQPPTTMDALVDIGTGAAGAEVVIATVRVGALIGQLINPWFPFYPMPFIASGARLATRAAGSPAAAQTLKVDAVLLPQ